jgi:ArsR family transcriptional regulator, arsenate/arsenite/antimonite-responsive transcriptional repressor / arsenate reductase (thioredoxin)
MSPSSGSPWRSPPPEASPGRSARLETLTGHRLDYLITLCDKAREVCPEFPDHPRRLHWSIPDPATAGDTDQASYPAFQRTAANIDTRIHYLLPVLAQPPESAHDDPRQVRQRPLAR